MSRLSSPPNPLPSVPSDRYLALAETYVSAADVSRTLFDDEGRPLGERYFPPQMRGHASFRMGRCPYADSRAGRVINIDALPGVVRNWEFTLAALVALRRVHLRTRADENVRWLDVWFLGRIATAVPAYLARRAAHPLPIVPVRFAALFKPSIGLYMVAERAFLTGADPSSCPSVGEAVGATHRTRALLSEDAACPASPRHLRDLMAVAVDGGCGLQCYPPGEEVDDMLAKRLVRYGQAVARLEIAKFVYFLDVEQRLARLSTAGALGRTRHMPVKELRGVPITPAALPSVARRLRAVSLSCDLSLPPPPSCPRDLAEELACDIAWARVLTELQACVLDALGWKPSTAVALGVNDLAVVAAYLALDWRYTQCLRRYSLAQRAGLEAPAEMRPTTRDR